MKKALELAVPGLLMFGYITATGIGMLVGAWSDNANMFLIGILMMSWIIAILLANVLRTLWQIRDRMNGER